MKQSLHYYALGTMLKTVWVLDPDRVCRAVQVENAIDLRSRFYHFASDIGDCAFTVLQTQDYMVQMMYWQFPECDPAWSYAPNNTATRILCDKFLLETPVPTSRVRETDLLKVLPRGPVVFCQMQNDRSTLLDYGGGNIVFDWAYFFVRDHPLTDKGLKELFPEFRAYSRLSGLNDTVVRNYLKEPVIGVVSQRQRAETTVFGSLCRTGMAFWDSFNDHNLYRFVAVHKKRGPKAHLQPGVHCKPIESTTSPTEDDDDEVSHASGTERRVKHKSV